ncbi:MAG: T9SS type A sorting domain-containing protein [Bacteroidota bacterium]|nr:T9SS type A sorting domain-containing protein [Bacteroidota bacterium]
MIKRLLSLGGALLFTVAASAQSYYYVKTRDANPAYNFGNNVGTTTVIPVGSNDVLSASQTLPFTFTFYGTPYSSYKASDNGYITFDNSAMVSMPMNTALTDAKAPEKSIFAFWDDLETKAVTNNANILSNVRSWTIGTAPNRIHVIQYSTLSPKGVTVTTGATNLNAMYFGILLYEGSNNIQVVHNYAYDHLVKKFSGTMGIKGTSRITEVSGSPNLVVPYLVPFNENADPAAQLVFTFYPGTQATNDIVLRKPNIKLNYGPSDNIVVSGQFNNFGADELNKLDIFYQVDSETPVKFSFLGNVLGGADYGTGNYTFPNKITGLASGKTYTLKVYTSNPNGGVDNTEANNIFTSTFAVNGGKMAGHRTLLEEGTGAWCGFCPDGHIILKNILDKNVEPNVIGVVHHNNDGMTNPKSDQINSTWQTGYPYGMIDRTPVNGSVGTSRNNWDPAVTMSQETMNPMEIQIINKTWDATTRTIKFDVEVYCTDVWNSDGRQYAVNAYIVENKVRGPSINNTWNQRNYFSKDDASAGGNGHPLYNKGAFLAGYYHNHVVRAVLGANSIGDLGVFPMNYEIGKKYTKSYTYVLPAVTKVTYTGTASRDVDGYFDTNAGDGANKPDDISIVAYVSYSDPLRTRNEILNSRAKMLTGWYAGVNDPKITAVTALEVFPNPAVNNATLRFDMSKAGVAEVSVFDALGKKVSILYNGQLNQGTQKLNVDLSTLNNGIYFVNVNAGGQVVTTRLVVNK